MKDLITKARQKWQANPKQFYAQAYTAARKYGRFPNIRNANVREMADREWTAKKLKRKFKHLLVPENTHSPKKHSNIVWVCWLQGYGNAPELVKTCISSVRKYLPDREIIIVDQNNIKEYTSIPEYIWEKYQKGFISFAHFSDIIRLDLLTRHGGLWVDSSVLLTSTPPKDLFGQDTPLFMFKSISLYHKQKLSTSASNWLIYACSNNDILVLTKKLIYAYWKKYNYADNYLFFHIFFTFATEVYPEQWRKVPSFSNTPPHILQFELLEPYSKQRFDQIKGMSFAHKLNRRLESKDQNTNLAHILKGEI